MRVEVTRVLPTAIGALLISVSTSALAQEYNGGPPQGEQQQGETARVERRCEPFPANPPHTWTRQDEFRQDESQQPQSRLTERPLAVTPETKPPEMQAEMVQDRRRQGEPEQPRAQSPERLADQQRELEQFLAQLPERPLADQQRELERLLAQLPERKPAEPAEMQRPARQAAGLLARLTQRQSPEEQQVETNEPRQPEAMKAETEQDQPMPTKEMEMPRDPKWTALTEASLGTTMDLPRAVFSVADGHAHKGVGSKYKTPDGRAKVAVWTQRNTRRDTPAGYLRRTFVIPRATLDYERFTPEFAAVSGIYGGKVYYIRCNLSPRGIFHCFDLVYPAREKMAWDGIVTRMSRSLRPLDD